MRARCCHAVVAAQRQLQTAAHAYAVNRRNDGLGRALYLRNHGVQIGLLQGCFLAKLLDIRAPREGLAGPGDHNGLHRRIGIGSGQPVKHGLSGG